MRSRQDLMIAVNRFGLGAKPGNLKDAAENPKQWLVDHLTAVEPDPELPDSSEISQAFGELKQLKLQAKADGKRLDKKYNRALQQSHM